MHPSETIRQLALLLVLVNKIILLTDHNYVSLIIKIDVVKHLVLILYIFADIYSGNF